ncbi:MAG: aspartate-semialdehyde dehydrogenase, partial [Oscillospiraceae bacterium]|nr:aspartate-semialdehyde dehydrogenase [Oscillospiraceae bacterium]
EEKSEKEPLRIWGKVQGGVIVPAEEPAITAQCIRVPVSDGHLSATFVTFKNKPSMEEMIETWQNYRGRAQELELPSAPKQFLHYFTEPDRPQTRSERELEGGMAVSIGRLRPDTQYDYKFVTLSHNTLRGAAGGGVLLAELLCADGYIEPRN